ncbi:MAG: winged helix-turn-helix transcriptional regulator, partial [Nanoarchaeota archaeon]|nr:winged helix-turn-helix transcriptional regulator [Nanoarchaeota archaeon]
RQELIDGEGDARGVTREIMRIIEKNKKPITQAALEKILKIPKSSLSRNIDSLVRKDIITKEGKGMSNVLFLKNK